LRSIFRIGAIRLSATACGANPVNNYFVNLYTYKKLIKVILYIDKIGTFVNVNTYFMNKRKLQLEQLDRKLSGFYKASEVVPPPTGWLKSVRTTLGMSLEQVAKRLSITKQSVREIENREMHGSVTLNTLRDVAEALDMRLIYGFVPKDGSLDQLIERKACELATEIVMRASNSMKLEDQQNSKERIKKAIDQRAASLVNELPKILWD
jgi:predicted DNA-binding mobile mystery protein A